MKPDEWLARLNALDVCSGTTEIDGLPVSVTEDTEHYSLKVTQTLTIDGTTFTRKGLKEISYEVWVDTDFGEWEIS